MKIAVTGASGFVGQPVVARLVLDGHHVRAVVRTAMAQNSPAAHEMLAGYDLEQESSWPAVVQGMDVVVHLAARAHVMGDHPQSSDALYRRANVHVTRGLALAAREAGVKRFVFMSSIKVNGERTETRPFTADDAPEPEDAYGRSKLEAEQVLSEIAAAGGMETVIVRPPLLYGPRVRGNMLRLIQLAERGLWLPVGAIRNARDILGVEALADLVARLVQHPAAAGGTFLARDGTPLSTPGLLQALCAALGRPYRAFPVPVSLMRAAALPLGASSLVARLTEDLRIDDSDTRARLEWRPPASFTDALAQTARWYREKPRT